MRLTYQILLCCCWIVLPCHQTVIGDNAEAEKFSLEFDKHPAALIILEMNRVTNSESCFPQMGTKIKIFLRSNYIAGNQSGEGYVVESAPQEWNCIAW